MVQVNLSAFLLASLGIVLSSAAKVSYDGFQVVRLPIEGNTDIIDNTISRLDLDTMKYTRSFADVLVPSEQLDVFNEMVADLNATIIDQNVGVSIAYETKSELSKMVQSWTPSR